MKHLPRCQLPGIYYVLTTNNNRAIMPSEIGTTNVQYNGGLLLDIILLTQCYLHRGTCLNVMTRFSIFSL